VLERVFFFFFSQQLERQNGQQWGVIFSPCLHSHMLARTHRKSHIYFAHWWVVGREKGWSWHEVSVDSSGIQTACSTIKHDHILLQTHTCPSSLPALLYHCLYFTYRNLKAIKLGVFFPSMLHPTSSLTFNLIYLSLSTPPIYESVLRHTAYTNTPLSNHLSL